MSLLKLRLTGVRGLLMHGDRYANPLDPMGKLHKVMTRKRNKTDEDHEKIAKSEWLGFLYHDEELGPYMPGVNIDASILAGAKRSRLGTTIRSSCEVMEEKCKLIYKGPRDIEGLWDAGFRDVRSVVVDRKRLMRFRPFFPDWSLECTLMFASESIERDQVLKSAKDAGMHVGIGDYRPRFGRFTVEAIEG